MARYKINVYETRVLNHTLEIETDKDFNDVDKICSNVEKEKSLDDLVHSLGKRGCKIIEINKDISSGSGKIEIPELDLEDKDEK